MACLNNQLFKLNISYVNFLKRIKSEDKSFEIILSNKYKNKKKSYNYLAIIRNFYVPTSSDRHEYRGLRIADVQHAIFNSYA